MTPNHRSLTVKVVVRNYRNLAKFAVLCRQLPNNRFNLSAQELRSWVPSSLRSSAPG